jgi:alcohol dehydrogenase (cytochrome c)
MLYRVFVTALLFTVAIDARAQSSSVLRAAPAGLNDPKAGEWPLVGRDYSNQHYSPLDQVTRANVGQLAPRLLFQLQMAAGAGGAEAAPVVVGSRMYATTNYGVVTALDLRTRKQLWRYEPKLGIAKPCCGPVNRGVAVANGLVYLGTLDSRLIALDADKGSVKWEVVNNDPDSAYSITMAPVVAEGLVIVGSSGGEFPTRGNVTAYDATTGARVWRWYAIPSPEDGGWWGKWTPTAPTGESLSRDIAAERADSAKFPNTWMIGGGPVWAQPAYDVESKTLYVTVGNPAPSNDGTGRPGDNLYTVSVVALDVATGKMRWYFQAVPHDVWDYDLATPPVIARVDGRKLLLVGSKMGWLYVLDASSGKLVRRSDPFVEQQNIFTVPTADGIVSAPGPIGGANWPPSAYSPRTGLLYVVASHATFTLTRASTEAETGKIFIGGDQKLHQDDAPYGVLAAVSPATGRVAWHQRLPLLMSGALVTAGDVVFVGDGDGWFRAFDARTGKQLWQFFAGAGVNAPAISFEVDGEQMIAVVAAGSRYSELHGSALLVFGVGTRSTAQQPVLVADARAKADVATQGEPAAAFPPTNATRVNRYLAYNAEAKTAFIELDADQPFGFDDATQGGRTFHVPLGWEVQVRLRNRDAAPHSARIVATSAPFGLTLPVAAFADAETPNAETGTRANGTDSFQFRAKRAGQFVIACAVPGHASAGMFLHLRIAPDITVPALR